MVKPTIYIFMNKSLGMSAGKLAAQSAHVMAEALTIKNQNDWWSAPQRTVLIMQARNQEHLSNISTYLQKRDITIYPLIDEGINETEPQVMTALATQVVDKDEVQEIFNTFELYRDKYRVILEVSE